VEAGSTTVSTDSPAYEPRRERIGTGIRRQNQRSREIAFKREQTLPTPSNEAVNPFDFRTPVTDPARLAGRSDEVEEIKRHLNTTAAGRPVHVALIGDRASGKTSLLNAVARFAPEYGLLPVRLDLDADVVRSPFSFFSALFDAAVTALVEHSVLDRQDPRYTAWIRQHYMKDTDVPVGDQLLLFGMVSSSAPAERSADPDVTPSLLHRDTAALASVAAEQGWNGFVIVLDEGDLLGENEPLIQKLRNLFQVGDRCMLVAAGTKRMFEGLSEVFSPIPRQFVRIQVGRFQSISQVIDCMTKPILEARRRLPPLLPDCVNDVMTLTRGSPYEINLVCYFMWQAIADHRQKSFALSTSVLDSVLEELIRTGRDVAVGEVEAMRALSTDDLEIAVDILPFQRLSVEEIALARLLLGPFSDEVLQQEVKRIERDLETLELCDVIARNGDRFSMRGGSIAQIYFKYLARRHISTHDIHARRMFDATYNRLLLDKVRERLREDLAVNEARVFEADQRTSELGDPGFGDWLADLHDAVLERDVVRLKRHRLIRNAVLQLRFTHGDQATVEGLRRDGLILVGLCVAAGIERIEVGELWLNTDSSGSAEEVAERIREWAVGLNSLLAKFNAQIVVEMTRVILVPADVCEAVFGTQIDSNRFLEAHGQVMDLFKDERLEEALVFLDETIRDLESVVRKDTEGRTEVEVPFKAILGDLQNRAGFIASLIGNDEQAERFLRAAIDVESHEGWLRHYNLAFVHALNEDFDKAAAVCSEAEKQFAHATVPSDGSTFMLVFAPAPADWASDNNERRFVKARGDELEALIRTQRLVYEALAGAVSRETFEALVPSSRSQTARKLVAWVRAAVFEDNAEALKELRDVGREESADTDLLTQIRFLESSQNAERAPGEGAE
jgi:AAA ATPase domain